MSDIDVDIMDDQQPEEELIKHQIVDALHPEPEGWNAYGIWKIVGHGLVTNPNTCGIHVTTKGCLRVDLHNVTTLNGENHANKVYVRRHPQYCYKSSCPSCYKYGWAVREAGRIEHRTKEAAKHFGIAEHIVMSISPRQYHLPFKVMRRKAINGLMNRGVIGGCLIFHGFRYKRHKGWYFSPHFHCIGFILGGYAKCRKCNKKYDCTVKASFECGGFVARSYKEHKKDAFICKVLGARKTVFGTAWYQLNHSSYDKTKKNFHIATWFGVCSYRKLKVTPEIRKELCPICQSELVDIRYIGSNREQFSGKNELFADLVENGEVVWVELPRKKLKGIAVAKNVEPYTTGEIDLWIAYAKGQRDDKQLNQVYTCFLCKQQILNTNEMRMLDGRLPVHVHCVKNLENGRKEVAC